MISSPSQCEGRSNSIISKWMFHQNCGSDIGTDSHFRCLLSSDVVKCTTRQLGMVRLRARTLPSRSKMIGGVCFRCSLWSCFEFLGPNCAQRNLGQGLRSKYEDGCMTCWGAWARETRVQGPKPYIGGPIPVQSPFKMQNMHSHNKQILCDTRDTITFIT